MSEQQPIPFYKPPLRPQRLIPAGPGIVPAEGLPVAAIGRQVESWREPSTEMPTPGLADGGQVLANRAWLFIEKAALTLDALPPIYRAAGVPEEALEDVELIGSLLMALPDLMASGLENNVARVDWMFSRLLNAPGHPGLIEAIMETVAALDLESAPAFDQDAAIEILRSLHRDVVTLQQSWDMLIEAMFPVLAPPAPFPQPDGDTTAKMPALPADALTSRRPPHAPGPLPAGLMIAPSATSGRVSGRSAPMYALGRRTPRLVILLVLALLAVTVVGLLLAQVRHTPALTPSSAALSVDQHTPTPTTASQPTPTQPLPTPTPTPPAPTPTTGPVESTPDNNICPRGAAFCVSALQLQASCDNESSVTFQLIGTTRSTESWQAFPLFSGAQVSLSPSRGTLKQNQTVTVRVQIRTTRQNPSGVIMILGPKGTSPITVTVQMCD